jgi:hypothetical protein
LTPQTGSWPQTSVGSVSRNFIIGREPTAIPNMKTETLLSVFSCDRQSDLLRAACRLFCMGILIAAAAQVSPSPPFFRSSRTAFDFVCLARLTKDS